MQTHVTQTLSVLLLLPLLRDTANLLTKTLDFGGPDSTGILILRGGIPRPTGNSPESLSQRILAGIILVWRLGVAFCPPPQPQGDLLNSLVFLSQAEWPSLVFISSGGGGQKASPPLRFLRSGACLRQMLSRSSPTSTLCPPKPKPYAMRPAARLSQYGQFS